MVDLNALAKIAGQILAAGIAVLNGVKVYWIPLPGTIISLDDATSIILTVALIFLSVNAINLIDGLDGLAAGVVAIGAMAFFVYAYWLSYEQELVRATTASLVTVATVGMCLGFLPYNVHPARMFMGDSGSMLLGFLLATSMISLTGQLDPSQIAVEGSGLAVNAYLPLILPLAVMALPLGDLIMAYVRRTIAGRLWFQADKEHLHHRMLKLGHSHRRAVALLWLWTGLFAFGAVVIGWTGSVWAIVALIAGLSSFWVGSVFFASGFAEAEAAVATGMASEAVRQFFVAWNIPMHRSFAVFYTLCFLLLLLAGCRGGRSDTR